MSGWVIGIELPPELQRELATIELLRQELAILRTLVDYVERRIETNNGRTEQLDIDIIHYMRRRVDGLEALGLRGIEGNA